MEFTVAKSDLQKELQLCQGVVERLSTIPILSNVLLKATKDRIELAATDLDVTLQTACNTAVKQQGMVTIDARRFFDLVRSLPEDDVKISLDENYSVQVESGSAKFRLLGLPAEDYPTLPKVDRTKAVVVDLQDFKTMVEKVVFAITHEETRFQLNGAFTKGFPPNVQMLDRLLDELVAARSAENPVPAEQLQAGWARLRDEAVSAQVDKLLAG